jgi:hypothetical protein
MCHSKEKFLFITNLMRSFMYLFIHFISLHASSIKCSSSGDRILLIHHLVWLVCVSDCLVCRSGGNRVRSWPAFDATAKLRKILKETFRRCFQQWQDRWSKYVCAQGSYFEGDYSDHYSAIPQFRGLFDCPSYYINVSFSAFSVAQQPNCCLGRLVIEVSRSHTIRHTNTHTHGWPHLN